MLSNSGFLPRTRKFPVDHSTTGPLAGMRLAVKDLFHIAGIPTTAGNPAWAESHEVPTRTNNAVAKLLSAGAEYVGKTVTDELAYSLNGQNLHYGTPCNIAAPDRLPGGSSSGSAWAVAANEADIGLGTDTGGSIRVPASYNGLYGLRPTHNVIAVDNMVPLAPGFDTVGWMTRDLTGMVKVAKVLLPGIAHKNAPVLGIADNLIEICEHSSLIRKWLSQVECEQRVLTDIDPFKMGLSDVFRILQGAQIWAQHGEWLIACKPKIADDIQNRLKECQAITAKQTEQAISIQNRWIEHTNVIFSHCDALVVPTTPGLAPLLATSAEELVSYRKNLLNLTAMAGLAGLPQLHLPLFTEPGAPCGVSLIGQRGSEHQLLTIAAMLME